MSSISGKQQTSSRAGALHRIDVFFERELTMPSRMLIAAGVLLMYGGRSDSKAVTLAMEQLSAILPHSITKEFPKLDHFGIERTAPREVAKAVSDYFLS